ncbi:hypothetical protein [Pseudolactococcus piscium]|uniref:Uncharacterized protein n=1 Tax=Pseudolactococcus piscium MKFS47 TaxID=297352 RepID=A0A0D6DZZ9_9LACT|nr:hypothetical protein [Lactococcus piscium]CEN29366.1 Uncharacterized protein LACPI_2166 [Lactococcus piscium MKFS47]
MKNVESLISSLREEYFRTQMDIAKAKFAVATLVLDDTEHEMLQEQIGYMEEYADIVISRANYARLKPQDKNDVIEPLLQAFGKNPFGAAFNEQENNK